MKAKKSKISGLVVAALRHLRDAHGSTTKEIMKYIKSEYNASEATVQRQLKTALKRGVEYGILKKTNAGYSLNAGTKFNSPFDLEEMDSCGKKKRRGCSKPKRCCPKKRKRNPCSKKRKCPKKRKRNPCNACASRGRKGDCKQRPIQLVHEGTPGQDDNVSFNDNDTDKRSIEDEQDQNQNNDQDQDQNQDQDQDQDQEQEQDRDQDHYIRSVSRTKSHRNRSRSQSYARSKCSESDMDEY
ncbi:PREDICTED: histone H5-like [Ceratosolen solmsi marchali]|uniref:Histone H5-like n=1 Tax=Ceratosolen solmsi marchali TaxID=326594 RepID=A0AAJ6VM96_9HYME|nr:PREDICTED: histone H5-like [Ceratosolen solmsi marchali]